MASLPLQANADETYTEQRISMPETCSQKLARLFAPRSIAFVGGAIAEMSIERCLEMGYAGEIWPVHPSRETVAGFPCYASLEELPAAPDAAYVGVNRELTIGVVDSLSRAGAGGCVCYAAGFSEMGEEGHVFQDQLVAAAADMPVIGPNTFGFVNYLERCALWPYLFGANNTVSPHFADASGHDAAQRGVALISQSGNIAMNLSMNARSVHLTHVIGTGNQAVLGAGDLIEALLLDDRVTAIGMYVEGFDDIEAFSQAAVKALEKAVPIVVMKVGKTEASARQVGSHTSSLTGSDVLHDALFERLGVIRVDSLHRLLETLKVLDLSGPLRGRNVFSLSCSGGEAAIMADLAPVYDLEMQPFSQRQKAALESQFGDFGTVSNPFDYNTRIWGDQSAQEQCFTAAMSGEHDAALLIYDHPTVQSPEVDEWTMTLDAFIAAHKTTGMPAFVVSTVSELLPTEMRQRLIRNGIVPLQGFDDGLYAYSMAAKYHEFRACSAAAISLPRFAEGATPGDAAFLSEWDSKQQLQAFGLSVPVGAVGCGSDMPGLADALGYPVVLKAVGAQFLHKSEMGAVALNLHNAADVAAAVTKISAAVARHNKRVEQFLVEQMVGGAVAELIVGIKRDEQFGPALVIGAGGILVELIADSASLLLPTDRDTVLTAVNGLTSATLLQGFRGKPAGDMDALVDAIMVIAAYAEANWATLLELDVNPLMVLPAGAGVIAADALIAHCPLKLPQAAGVGVR
jgi:acyl-CoA synthetase (NDP forming)